MTSDVKDRPPPREADAERKDDSTAREDARARRIRALDEEIAALKKERDALAQTMVPSPHSVEKPSRAAEKEVFAHDLQRAWRLADFILGDQRLAWTVAREALRQRPQLGRAQAKRPDHVKKTGEAPRKQMLTPAQQLQFLVLCLTTPFEKKQEELGVSSQDLVLRFIKHVVERTFNRQADLLTLGICRVLHAYPTREALKIYGHLEGEDEAAWEDLYKLRRRRFLSRKSDLMTELKERLGDAIDFETRGHGERRFIPDPNPHRFHHLLTAALRQLEPWGVNCPAVEAARSDAIRHRLLCQKCLKDVAEPLGLEPLEAMLDLPLILTQHEDNPRPLGGRPSQVRPTEEQIEEVWQYVRQEEARYRTGASYERLEISTDGQLRATLRSGAADRTVTLGNFDNLLEVVGVTSEGDRVQLALVPLADWTDGEASALELPVPGGPVLDFEPAAASGEEADTRTVRLIWRLEKPAASWWREIWNGLLGVRVPVPALALATLLVLSLGVGWWTARFHRPGGFDRPSPSPSIYSLIWKQDITRGVEQSLRLSGDQLVVRIPVLEGPFYPEYRFEWTAVESGTRTVVGRLTRNHLGELTLILPASMLGEQRYEWRLFGLPGAGRAAELGGGLLLLEAADQP